MRFWFLFLIGLAILISMDRVLADEVSVSGTITQSTADGTGPAVNNPSLNNIADGDTYTVTLDFAGSITTTGTYDLTGASLVFSDPAAPATESSFDAIGLTVAADGASDDISLLGCLTTGDGCLEGNFLAMNFAIPAGDLNSPDAPASPIPALTPLDLEEDDGVTDIQGGVANYSYTPEPSSLTLFGLGLLGLSIIRTRRQHRSSSV